MALTTSHFPRSNSYYSLPEQWTPSIRPSNLGFAYTFSCLEISKGGPKPFTLSKILLSRTNYDLKRKRIRVANPATSFTKVIELLDAYEDEYDGAIINSDCLPNSVNAFSAILQSSLSYWKQKGKKGIWLKILEEQADLVPVALKEGFRYHHAEPGYVMLTYWIPDEPCILPSTATHQVGVGGFVINENGQVLVVKEKKGPLRCSGIWKMPTGFINKSEEIFNGAVREVKEETGINTEFLEVVAFRHAHQVIFETSDLFFICMLKPISLDITIDESEIQAAKWMPLDEYMNQPFHREDRMTKNMIDICIARYENRYQGFTTHQIMSKFDDRLSYLYSTEGMPPNGS